MFTARMFCNRMFSIRMFCKVGGIAVTGISGGTWSMRTAPGVTWSVRSDPGQTWRQLS